MIGRHNFQLLLNRHHGTPGVVVLPDNGFRRAKEEIASWPGYAPTPLLPLPDAAEAARVASVHWKDEGGRFGPRLLQGAGRRLRGDAPAGRGTGAARGGAFRHLGRPRGGQAQGGDARDHRDLRDGRQPRPQRRLGGAALRVPLRGLRPPGVSKGRRDAIAAYGREVREAPGTYDDSVRAAKREAEKNGWFVVSDTSYPGYTEPPRDVMQGYRLLAEEAAEALPAPPTHVFVPGGVGGLAAAVSAQMRARYGKDAPRLVVAEPDRAACLMASAEAGQLTAVDGPLDTVMAGWPAASRASSPGRSWSGRPSASCPSRTRRRSLACARCTGGSRGSWPGKARWRGWRRCCSPGATPSGGRRWSFRREPRAAPRHGGRDDPELHAKLVAGDAG
jgi:diaminopropionate ammonia-lyase